MEQTPLKEKRSVQDLHDELSISVASLRSEQPPFPVSSWVRRGRDYFVIEVPDSAITSESGSCRRVELRMDGGDIKYLCLNFTNGVNDVAVEVHFPSRDKGERCIFRRGIRETGQGGSFVFEPSYSRTQLPDRRYAYSDSQDPAINLFYDMVDTLNQM